MKTSKLIIAAALVTVLNIGLAVFSPLHSAAPQPVSAASDKSDGDCDPTDTAGRCSDKCPAPTAEGAYNQLGTDPTTGAAICHFVFTNACPYSEAVSADDPMCYKNQPAGTQPVTTPPAATTPTVNQCGGK